MSFIFYQNVPVYENYKGFSDKPSYNRPIIIYSEFLLQENKNRIYRAKVAPSLSLFPRLYSYKIPFRVPTHTCPGTHM